MNSRLPKPKSINAIEIIVKSSKKLMLKGLFQLILSINIFWCIAICTLSIKKWFFDISHDILNSSSLWLAALLKTADSDEEAQSSVWCSMNYVVHAIRRERSPNSHAIWTYAGAASGWFGGVIRAESIVIHTC